MIKSATGMKYRVFIRVDTGKLQVGFVDDDGEPTRFGESAETYYDDKIYTAVTEINRDRMKTILDGLLKEVSLIEGARKK
jgi:hypothetical protein